MDADILIVFVQDVLKLIKSHITKVTSLCITKDCPNEHPKEHAKEHAKDHTKEQAKEHAKEHAKRAPKRAPKRMPKRMPKRNLYTIIAWCDIYSTKTKEP